MSRAEHQHHEDSCAICALDAAGLRVTRQRQILFEVLAEEANPMSAEQIHFRLKSREVEINLSTVYRALEQFVGKGLVLKTSFAEETKSLYSINTHEHHHHLICSSCKEIVIISGCPVEAYVMEVERSSGYRMEGHKLEIYGICPKCQEQDSE